MCTGYEQILQHFISGTWASWVWDPGCGSWNQSLVDTEGWLRVSSLGCLQLWWSFLLLYYIYAWIWHLHVDGWFTRNSLGEQHLSQVRKAGLDWSRENLNRTASAYPVRSSGARLALQSRPALRQGSRPHVSPPLSRCWKGLHLGRERELGWGSSH